MIVMVHYHNGYFLSDPKVEHQYRDTHDATAQRTIYRQEAKYMEVDRKANPESLTVEYVYAESSRLQESLNDGFEIVEEVSYGPFEHTTVKLSREQEIVCRRLDDSINPLEWATSHNGTIEPGMAFGFNHEHWIIVVHIGDIEDDDWDV